MEKASKYFEQERDSYLKMAGEAKEAAELYKQAGNLEQAQNYARQATQAVTAAKTMGTLAVATSDVTLNCDQTGWGFTPILGVDYKIGKLNLAAKYEFKTRIRLENRSANSESANNLAALSKFQDGKKVEMQVKPGDKVIYSQYSGTNVKLEEEEFIIVSQKDIAAIVED